MLQLNIFLGGKEDCETCETRGGRNKNRRLIWFPLGPCCSENCNTGEITHCQSMKGSFPRDCLISAYLHLLAKHSHGRTDTEAYGHTGTLQIIENSFMSNIWGDISAAACVTCVYVCSVSAGLHGIYFLFFFKFHGYSVS